MRAYELHTGIGAAIGTAVAGIGGAVLSSNAASSAAKDQENASLNAQQIQQQENQQIVQNEAPFLNSGQAANSELGQYLGTSPNNGSLGGGYGKLLQPFTADMLSTYSPDYQFALQQGRQGTLNGSAGGAGALSGAAQKSLEGYNTQEANTLFSNAASLYYAGNQQTYSNLMGQAQLGQAAASQEASSGTALAGSAGNAAISAGNAAASGAIGTANAYSNALTGGANAYGQYAALSALQGQAGNGQVYSPAINQTLGQIDSGSSFYTPSIPMANPGLEIGADGYLG